MKNSTLSDHVTDNEIKIQEDELKELLNRVMKSPLQPLEDKIALVEKRLQNVEKIIKYTADENLPALQAETQRMGEELRKDFKRLHATITEETPEWWNNYSEAVRQEIAHILDAQMLVKDNLSLIQQEQLSQGKQTGNFASQGETLLRNLIAHLNEINNLTKTVVQTFEKTVVKIDENHEQIGKSIDVMRADGRLGIQQLGNGIDTLAASLSQASVEVIGIAPMLAGRTDELGSRIEGTLAQLKKILDQDRYELFLALEIIQKRVVWLSVLCGLGFIGAIGFIIRSLVTHL